MGGGSSPLTRGKLADPLGKSTARRLIPAHAGKTRIMTRRTCAPTAHPRSRGENGRLAMRALTGAGSSPLTRGKPSSDPRQPTQPRLIPAHAGKTPSRKKQGRPVSAHPRSRGENGHPERRVLWKCGSSPLTRGKQCGRMGHHARKRLIPAHAGKTVYLSKSNRSATAHPRSRGENEPRRMGHHRHGRLIPAHAGKTEDVRKATDLNAAHPRSRGENTS